LKKKADDTLVDDELQDLLQDELIKVRKELRDHYKFCNEHRDLNKINIRLIDGHILETLKCNPECENEGCIKCKEDITCSEAQQLNKELKELREALQLC